MNDMKLNPPMMLAGVSIIRTFLFLSLFFFCGSTMAQEKTVNIRDDVLSSINENTVKKIEIVNIPYIATTNTAISPDELENSYLYKFIIYNEALYPYLHSLVDALKEININHSKIKSDLRWGVILYDSADKRIVSLYIDSFGINGYINSAPTTFIYKAGRDGLLWWFESNSQIYKVKKTCKEGKCSEPKIIEVK